VKHHAHLAACAQTVLFASAVGHLLVIREQMRDGMSLVSCLSQGASRPQRRSTPVAATGARRVL